MKCRSCHAPWRAVRPDKPVPGQTRARVYLPSSQRRAERLVPYPLSAACLTRDEARPECMAPSHLVSTYFQARNSAHGQSHLQKIMWTFQMPVAGRCKGKAAGNECRDRVIKRANAAGNDAARVVGPISSRSSCSHRMPPSLPEIRCSSVRQNPRKDQNQKCSLAKKDKT